MRAVFFELAPAAKTPGAVALRALFRFRSSQPRIYHKRPTDMTTTLMSTPLATSTSTSLALAAAVVPLSTPFLWRKITALARFDWASRWGKRQQSQAPFSVSALGYLYESTVGTFRTGLTALDCLDAPPGHGELLYARALEGDQAARDSVRFIQVRFCSRPLARTSPRVMPWRGVSLILH